MSRDGARDRIELEEVSAALEVVRRFLPGFRWSLYDRKARRLLVKERAIEREQELQRCRRREAEERVSAEAKKAKLFVLDELAKGTPDEEIATSAGVTVESVRELDIGFAMAAQSAEIDKAIERGEVRTWSDRMRWMKDHPRITCRPSAALHRDEESR